MILGIGTDLVEIATFRAQIEQVASSFVSGTFTPGERALAESRAGDTPEQHLAGRFAAKEAFLKAWSTAHGGSRPAVTAVDFREIEVVSDALGRPSFRLGGAVARAFDRMGTLRTHLSISHDGDFAIAFVILEQI